MARYFGGFRDRLKKKTRNLSLSEKDIEWLDVSTTFSWAPARRDYQWLEPEDYLSSFLNSSANEPEYSGVPAGDGIGENFGIYESGGNQGADAPAEEENDLGYMPPYDFAPGTPSDDTLTGSSVEIPADLPHLDEYKLEINSALQRRGIHIEPEQIKVPDELAFHLKNYHEKGRSNIDSYELRARLQNYKKQVIEAYEYSSHGKGSFLAFEGENKGDVQDENAASIEPKDLDTKDYESFIVSSLDRLEESMKEEAVDSGPGILGSQVKDPDEVKPGSEPPEIQTPFFSNPPSSFADDSWLVLPVDSTGPANQEVNTPDNSKKDLPEWDIFKKDQVKAKGASENTASPNKKPKSLFKREEDSDSNGILKALNTINSNLTDAPIEDDLDSPVEFFSNKNIPGDAKDGGSTDINTPEKQANTDNKTESTSRKRVALFQRSDAGKVGDLLKEEKLNSRLKEDPFAREKTRKEVKFKHNPTIGDDLKESSRKEVRFPDVFASGSDDKTGKTDEPGLEEEFKPKDKPTEQLFPGINEAAEPPKARRVEVKLNNRLKSDIISIDNTGSTVPLEEIKPVEAPQKSSDTVEPQNENELDEDTTLSDLLLRLRHEGDSTRKKTDQDAPDQQPASDEPVSEPEIKEYDSRPKEAVLPPIEEAQAGFDIATEEEAARSVQTESNEVMEPAQDEPVNETMDQRRARFIEEERKKLYSLIGRLEHSAEHLDLAEDKEPALEPEQSEPVLGLEKNEPVLGFEQNEPVLGLEQHEPVLGFEQNEPVLDPELDNPVFEPEQNELVFEAEEGIQGVDVISDALEQALNETLNVEEEITSSMHLSGWQHEEMEDLGVEEDINLEIEEETPILETQIEETILLVDPVPETSHHFERSDTEEETENTPLEENIAISDQELQKDQLDAVFFSAQGSESSMNEEKVVMPQSENTNEVTVAEEQVSDIPQKEPELSTPEKVNTYPVGEEVEAPVPVSIDFDEVKPGAEQLPGVVECLAFAAEEPIPLKQIARIFSEVQGVRMPSEEDVMAVIETLNEQYEKQGRSFRIKMWGRGVRMATHPQYAKYIRAIYQDNRPKKLSRTLMETLSIIAYSQPTTKPEIDFVRGVDSDYAVRKLLEIGLIDIVGRSDSIGRPLLYGTSERFLDQFGLSELEALPKLREVEELLGDPAFQKERLHLLALENMDDKESTGKDNGSAKEASMAPESEEVTQDQEPKNEQENA